MSGRNLKLVLVDLSLDCQFLILYSWHNPFSRTYHLLQTCNVIIVVNFGYDILFSSNNNTAMMITMNAYFWHIWETKTQQDLVQWRNILKLGRKMLYRITSLMIILLSSYIASLSSHSSGLLIVLTFMLSEQIFASYCY